ncbi:MAG TPA: ECF-type sigma factor [Pirellulales bacterium]|nr:ECF-type sigma factor [Pirellulales bacterium]
MAGEEQRFELTDWVLEAIAHRRWRGTNDNPALGKAVLHVEKRLLPWVREQLENERDDTPPDAENLVAEAGCKALLHFDEFTGVTGGEFYRWMETIAAWMIADVKRQRDAQENGGFRRGMSLERAAEAARLAELLISPDVSPHDACVIRENAVRVHRAMRGLTHEQHRVERLRMGGHSLRDIAATFGHSASWVHEVWESGAQHLRTKLMRGERTRREPVEAGA